MVSFPKLFGYNQSFFITGLFLVRSPLLEESRLLSFPPGT